MPKNGRFARALYRALLLLGLAAGFGAGPALGQARPPNSLSDRDFGAKADGVTDDSQAVMRTCAAAAVAHKVCFLERNTVVSQAIFSGPGFDGLVVVAPYWIHGTAAIGGMVFQNAANLSYTGQCDERAPTQPQNEHVMCLNLFGVNGMRLNASAINLRGDGVYISEPADKPGQMSRNVTGTVTCMNSVDDGRNCVSIITARHVRLTVRSEHVGGKVGGRAEPGGVDLEPNLAGQVIDDVTIQANLVCGPDTGGCLQALAGNGAISDITFSAHVKCATARCGRLLGTHGAKLDLTLESGSGGSVAPYFAASSGLSGKISSNGGPARSLP